MKRSRMTAASFAAVVAMAVSVSDAQADVVIETVTVGDPGNAGENSGGIEPGGHGPDRICGAVDYVYRIGTFEVTAAQYTEFLNAVAETDTYDLYDSRMNSESWGCQITQDCTSGNCTYDFSGGEDEDPGSTAADWENRPVNYVSWGDAARFANWLHNGQPGLGTPVPQDENSTEDGSYYLNGATTTAELMAVVREEDATWVIPSEDEWYKAAYYDTRLESEGGPPGDDHYWLYPTVDDIDPSNDLIEPDLGNNATFFIEPDDWTIGSPYYRTERGAHENSASPYGTFDQGANVWEWNEAIMVDTNGNPIRGQRGGSFYQLVSDLTASFRGDHPNLDPAYALPHCGFRLATFTDCNANAIPDECDLDCGATVGMTGGSCSAVYPGCGGSADENDNGIPDECAPDIPTVSEWGLIVMSLLLLAAGTLVVGRRRSVSV